MVDDSPTDEPSSTELTRRSYLTGLGSGGVLLGASALLGRSGTPNASAEPLPTQETGGYEVDQTDSDSDVIDLGEEGMEEGDDAGSWLSEYIEDGAEIVVPAGRYDYSTRAFTRGLGDGYADVTVRGEGEFGDVVFDHGDGYTFSEVIAANGGDVLLDNIVWRGIAGGNGNITVQAAEGNEVTLRRIARPDGSNDHGEGVFVRPEHTGAVTLEDCWLEGFADNGLYGSAPANSKGNDGEVNVIGGLYRNNNIANVRIGGTNSTIEGATVVLDQSHGDGRWSNNDIGTNMRGIWVREGTSDQGADITIRDCDVYNELPYAPVEINPRDGGGSGVITDTRIYNESDELPAIGHHGGEWDATDIEITGPGNTDNNINPEDTCTGSQCEQASRTAAEPIGDR